MPSRALIIFARDPKPSHVKTRLSQHLGPRAACDLYIKLLRYTLGIAYDFQRRWPKTDVYVAVTPAEAGESFRSRFALPWSVMAQEGDHLGRRMARAFQELFHRGYEAVLLIGSDVANITVKDLQDAFTLLEHRKAVLGPAEDGGFYAVGLRRPCPEAFSSPHWGTSQVFQRTLSLLQTHGLTPALLPMRHDVDRVEDLVRVLQNPFFRHSVSVVVPTLSEALTLQPWIQGLQGILWPGDDICVVRGLPHQTSSLSRHDEGGVLWLNAPLGRGRQLNWGARHTRGEILWFLHDDCAPGFTAAYQVRKILCDPECSLGCFRLAFFPTNRFLQAIATWANWRTRLFRLPYGDQGFFCRRPTFETLGGFVQPYLMEDVDFAKACRRRGSLLILDDVLTTSSRRYLRHGILKASWHNHVTFYGHVLGVSNIALFRKYYKRQCSIRAGEEFGSL